MVNITYYGAKNGTTDLELSTQVDGSNERIVQRSLRDQDAYDAWHLALYFKELLSCKRILALDSITIDQLPRKEKNLLLYIILACQPQFSTVLELGSTLFELIDSLQLVDKFFRKTKSQIPAIDVDGLAYHGIEISALFQQASTVLHPNHSVTLYPDASQAKGRYDVICDRNVTSYAFNTAQALADFINQSNVALLNLYLSKGETFMSARYGKSLTYFSMEELIGYLDKPLYHLFGLKAPGPDSGPPFDKGNPVVEGHFLCADSGVAEEFVAMALRDPQVNAYFSENQIMLKDAVRLLE